MVKYVQTFDHTSIMPLWTNHLGMLTGHNFGQMQEFLLSPMWCHIITHYFSTNTTNPPELLWSSNWEIGNLCREMIMATTPGFCRLIERSRPPASLSSPPLLGDFSLCFFYHFLGELFHSTLFPEFSEITNVEFVIQFSINIHCVMELSNLWLLWDILSNQPR